MARPLPPSDHPRSGTNGHPQDRTALPDTGPDDVGPSPKLAQATMGSDELVELEHLRAQNAQLRTLCLELEQALQEAAQSQATAADDRIKEYETLLDQKSDMIRTLHEQLQQTRSALEEAEAKLAATGQAPSASSPAGSSAARGPAPREEELLALSEELERERRQLQEDEQALMEQMREMEISMAKERADMARQRNDLQRLQGEIRHELERLERHGALQSRLDGLRTRLQDATNRRGAAPTPFKK